ncbi:MAG TPA: SAM-dependent methyltransferase [Bacteroidales bacterium]|nr:SAM-dependent methyltransferase [Bacteroidales bacterium]
MAGKLYLIPVTLGSDDYNYVLPDRVLEITRSLRSFIVEDLRSARRFLRMIDRSFPIDESVFRVLNKHTEIRELGAMITQIELNDTGLMSEAGMPGIADPGAPLISAAHNKDLTVVPLSGPSSVFLALSASGFIGQNFAFNGYLPIDKGNRSRQLKRLESLANQGQVQVFMETPYRNISLVTDLLNQLGRKTKLCIAAGITTGDEYIKTMSVGSWIKEDTPEIHKKPAIFIIGK